MAQEREIYPTLFSQFVGVSLSPLPSARQNPRNAHRQTIWIEPDACRRERFLRTATASQLVSRRTVSLRDFAETHPKLVIAQWISCIDKIITRPEGNSAPSEDQWFLRNTLGAATWKLIVEHDLLHAPEKRMERLEREWWSRIHPYGPDADYTAPHNFRGRWYSALARDMERETFNADRVAQRIYEHLYQAAYRIEPGQPRQRTGLLAARADSIARNVYRLSLPPNL